jgi:hypothetical protein
MPIKPTEQAESYRYLRIAMVGLLVALAVAVFYQSIRQGSLLASVSAYYYTPARSVFVGALIGLGVSMIALQGMDNAEDTFLNLGGIFAIVVAIVPTGRGADFDTAVRACQKASGAFLTQPASKRLACPTVLALETASRANVQNNMATLLIVGFLVLVLAGVIVVKGRTANSETPGYRWVYAGFSAAALLWLCGLIALVVSIDWLAAHGHSIAAVGLFVFILAVVVVNARRRQERPAAAVADVLRRQERPAVALRRLHRPSVRGALQSLRASRYTWIAIVMALAAAVLVPLWLTNVISLFWVEISVAGLFILFWVVQTFDLEHEAGTQAPVSPLAAWPAR